MIPAAGSRFRHRPLTRAVARLVIVAWILADVPPDLGTAGTAPVVAYVSASDPGCGGATPCFPTIQAAVTAAPPGGIVRVLAGTYREAVLIKARRQLTVEADPGAAPGSVVLAGRGGSCGKGTVVTVHSSTDVTIRGFSITGATGRAVRFAGGGKQKNQRITIERNRIVANGSARCQGGILIGSGHADTVILNNLLSGNGQDAIKIAGRGGPHYVVQNTIHGNRRNGLSLSKGQAVTVVNNIIVGNGTDPKPATQRYGIRRPAPKRKPQAEKVLLLHNLVCGNGGGELFGGLLDDADEGNLTPAGTEGHGVAASPRCGDAVVVYTDVAGADFTPATGSPAVDAGTDPRARSLPIADALLTRDLAHDAVRPADGNFDGVAVFDVGAIERPGPDCAMGSVEACYDGAAGTAGVGPCHAGTHTCLQTGTYGACENQVVPQTESCNAADDNCNGQVDETGCNHPPVITSSPATGAAVGGTYSYSVAASDPDAGDTLTYSVPTAPAGMTIDAATGMIHWTPAAGQTGDQTVVVRVRDQDGLFARQRFVLPVPGFDTPIARGDHYQVRQGEVLTVAAAGVLANDEDPGGLPLTAAQLTDPDKGTVDTFGANGSFSYTAPATLAGAPPLTVAIQANPSTSGNASLLAGDLDGDGVSEIVSFAAQTSSGDGPTVFKRDGTILFEVHQPLPVAGDNCIQQFDGMGALADVNDDGKMDIVFSVYCQSDDVPTYSVGAAQRVAAITYDAMAPNKYVLTWLSPALTLVKKSSHTWRVRYTVARLAPAEAPSVIYGTESTSGCDDIIAGKTDPHCRIVTILNGMDGTVTRRLYDAPPNLGNGAPRGIRTGVGEAVPVVADLDGDGSAEVVFRGTVWHPDGAVVLNLDGPPNGEVLFTDTVVADLDGDGAGEIIGLQPYRTAFTAGSGSTVLRAFHHDGSLLWSLPIIPQTFAVATRPVVADIDRDGSPDILFQSNVFLFAVDATGHVKWVHDFRADDPAYPGNSFFHGRLAVYDLNGDGVVEVVVPLNRNHLVFLRGDNGTTQLNYDYGDGLGNGQDLQEVFVADLDGNGHAELVWSQGIGNVLAGHLVILDGGVNPWRPAPRQFPELGWTGSNRDAAGHVLSTGLRWWDTPDGVRRNPIGNVWGQQPEAPYPSNPRAHEQAEFTYAAQSHADAVASAPAKVTIDIMPPNRPPVFTDVPPSVFVAAPGQPLVFQFTATDPDVGDTVTFSLAWSTCYALAVPTVDAGGLLTQNALSGDQTCSYAVAADDGHGGTAEQSFVITILPSAAGNTLAVPNVVGQSQGVAGATLNTANLVVGHVTTLTNVAPAGQVLSQQPAAASTVLRYSSVDLTVSSGTPPGPNAIDDDGDGFSEDQGDCDDTDPGRNPGAGDTAGDGLDQNCDGIDGVLVVASITVTRPTGRLLVGETAVLDAAGILGDGSAQDVSSNAIWASSDAAVVHVAPDGTVTAIGPGTATITATRNGTSGSTTMTVLARVGDPTDPTAAITAPVANATVSGPTAVVGTATDPNFLKYVLAYAEAGDETFTTFAEGTAPVAGGALGTFDPTMLLNDLYTVRLTVYDRGGNVTVAQTTVQAAGNQKVGPFTLAFQDLVIPLPGLPITVTRTYDSRDKGVGDFGVGWRLDTQTIRVRSNRRLGTGWQRGQSGFQIVLQATDEHKVTLTLPNGKVEEFDLVVSPRAGVGDLSFTQVTGFTPRAGTLGQLRPLGNTNLLIFSDVDGDVLVDDETLDTYDPASFRYTTPDGAVVDVGRNGGITSFTDRNGNTLTFGANGVTHSAGQGVTFTRDVQGRITKITDLMGHDQTYGYDGQGDLIRHTDRAGGVTTFKYAANHFLRDVVNPNGVRATRNTYDAEGRLVSVINPDGSHVDLDHDMVNHQEVVHQPDGTQRVFGYDARGNVTTLTDGAGHTVHRTYDANDRVTQETDALGHTLGYTYDVQGRRTTMTNAAGKTSTYAYGTRGQLTTSTDALGNSVAFTLDAKGNTLSRTDATGQTITYSYDAQGNMATATDENGHVSHFLYDAAGRYRESIDAAGHHTTIMRDGNGTPTAISRTVTTPGGPQMVTVTMAHDANGRLTTLTDAEGHTQTLTHDFNGNVTGSTDGLGHQTTFAYDDRNQRTSVGISGGPALHTGYDNLGRVTQGLDASGLPVRPSYDAAGNATKIAMPDLTPNDPNDNPAMHVEYNVTNAPTGLLDEAGGHRVFGYDVTGRVTSVTDAVGHVSGTTYDDAGRATTLTNGVGDVTQYVYDALGRPTSVHLPGGSTIARGYDAAGNLTTETDANGRITSYEYDVLNQLTAVVLPTGARTIYTYDELGRVTTQEDAAHRQTHYEYDRRGLLTKITRPLGQQETRAYDAVGHLAAVIDANGDTTQFTYDAAGRLTAKHFADNTTVQFTYTLADSLATMVDARGTTTFAYDERGRLASRTEPDGKAISYAYDAANRITGITTPAGTTTYALDAAGHVLTVTDPTNVVTTYDYDGAGRVLHTTFPNGIVETRAYDPRGLLISVVTENVSNQVVTSFTSTYDAAGNRSTVTEQDGRTEAVTYDAADRVLSETITPAVGPVRTITYTYDAPGNRLTRDDSTEGLTQYAYDANDRLVTATLGATVTTYTYDANGSRLSESRSPTDQVTYQWGPEARLAGVTRTVGVTSHIAAYAYDGTGMRVAQTVDGVETRYLLDPTRDVPNVLEEHSAVGTTVASEVLGQTLISRRTAGGPEYLLRDALGSVRALTDATGAVVGRTQFDAFGRVFQQTGDTAQPFQFAGEPTDPVSGLTYLRARYLDRGTGTFLSADPLAGQFDDPGSLHRYLYARGNPFTLTDPSGLESSLVEVLTAITILSTVSGALLAGIARAGFRFTGSTEWDGPTYTFSWDVPTTDFNSLNFGATRFQSGPARAQPTYTDATHALLLFGLSINFLKKGLQGPGKFGKVNSPLRAAAFLATGAFTTLLKFDYSVGSATLQAPRRIGGDGYPSTILQGFYAELGGVFSLGQYGPLGAVTNATAGTSYIGTSLLAQGLGSGWQKNTGQNIQANVQVFLNSGFSIDWTPSDKENLVDDRKLSPPSS